MTTPVKFEIARLLTYTNFNQMSVNIGYSITTKELSFDYSLEYMNQKAIAAPTIAEVCMWLYEKYNIWVNVYLYKDHVADVNDDYMFRSNYTKIREYNTPEQAYEAAFEHVLNNMI